MKDNHRFASLASLLRGLRGSGAPSPGNLMGQVGRASVDAILILDEKNRVEALNPAAEAMFGIREAEARRRPVDRFLPDGLPEEEATAGADGRSRSSLARRLDGTELLAEAAVRHLDVGGQIRRAVFLRDITRRRAHEAALEHQATHDALTELPNRFLLQRRVVEALDAAEHEASPVAFLLVDLDRFKEVNDNLGHHMGDLLLRKVAARLRSPLRPADTIARFGGDEFAILLPGVSQEEARSIAVRLIQAVKEPFDVQGLTLQVDASIGIAMYPDHGREVNSLIQRADVAMYAAKKVRNTVAFYNPETDFNSARHLTLQGELRHAVEQNHLVLNYQPKISTKTGRIGGVEALIRWRHPKHGLLRPDEFIPLAEHTGLIRPLIRWVLGTALRQCAAWEDLGMRIPVSVNCSARNLLEEDLPRVVRDALEACRIPAERLTLEITETILIEDPVRALEVATDLAGLGVRIAIDDFGTGYSSLEYLRRLPVKELKIDKSFVRSMDENDGDAVIVRSTVDLAHNLGMQAVAEGVETESVWKLLRELGCDSGQGYHFARPLPAREFGAWLRSSPFGAGRDLPRAGESTFPAAEGLPIVASRER